MNIVIDNYDSFTYNLVQYIGEIDPCLKVYKNNEISISDIEDLSPDHIIISPGPGRPESSGISKEIINNLKNKIPILGICLGHQAIGLMGGANIINAKEIYHGKTSKIFHNSSILFKDVPSPFTATRYHSLLIEKSSLNNNYEIIARSESKEIMGIQHKSLPLFGLQFHPESILTEYGLQIIKNFLNEVNW